MFIKDIGNFRIGETLEDPVFIKFIKHDQWEDGCDWKYEIQFLKWYFCFGYNPLWYRKRGK